MGIIVGGDLPLGGEWDFYKTATARAAKTAVEWFDAGRRDRQ
jgi:hypothetical protein